MKSIKKSKAKLISSEKPLSMPEKISKRNPKEESNTILNYLELHSKLNLQIELVPQSCWCSNVRSNLKTRQWDLIRKTVYENANYRCEICGEQGTKHRVECHEVWGYDENSLIQKLKFFQALCPFCHEVKHIGKASELGNYQRAFNRFQVINQIEKNLARQIRKAVFEQWMKRSKMKWKLDVEHLRHYGINPSELVQIKNIN